MTTITAPIPATVATAESPLLQLHRCLFPERYASVPLEMCIRDRFWLAIDGEDVHLWSDEGHCEEFTGLANDGAWLAQVLSERKAVMIVGSMGLDRFDMERANALLADGKIVAGVVPLR